MHTSQLVRVWADIASSGKCKWCKHPIVWRTTFDRGKTLPFDALGTSYGVEKDDNGRKIETLCWNDLHKCEQRPKTQRQKTGGRWKALPPQRRFF